MKILVLALAITVAVIGASRWVATGAEPVTVDRIGDQNQTLPRGQLPVFASNADTAALYRFAVDNPDTLRFMPCTCGCGDASIGHASNRACYIKDEPPGRVTFTSHAAT
jgi:hypothetical protein